MKKAIKDILIGLLLFGSAVLFFGLIVAPLIVAMNFRSFWPLLPYLLGLAWSVGKDFNQ